MTDPEREFHGGMVKLPDGALADPRKLAKARRDLLADFEARQEALGGALTDFELIEDPHREDDTGTCYDYLAWRARGPAPLMAVPATIEPPLMRVPTTIVRPRVTTLPPTLEIPIVPIEQWEGFSEIRADMIVVDDGGCVKCRTRPAAPPDAGDIYGLRCETCRRTG